MHIPPGYAEYPAPTLLAGVVECFWTQTPTEGPKPTLVLPDACVDLIWSSRAGLFAAGPDTQASLATGFETDILVGLRFRPGAGGAALGLPLVDIQNRRIFTAELWNARRQSTRSRNLLPLLLACDETDDPHEVLRLFSRIAMLVSDDVDDRSLTIEATRRLRRPDQRIAPLADELGVGQRRLHRAFLENVGYGAKTLQRILRFQTFLALQRPGVSLAQISAEAGYADQAHLSRDCLALSGLTPSALLASR